SDGESCSGIRSWASGEWTVISLLKQLLLLPLAIDHRVEALRMLDRPDLRADHEIPGIDAQRAPPGVKRIVLAALAERRQALRDGQHQEITPPALPVTLPPGQLLPARSPCREAEDDGALAEEVDRPPRAAVHINQFEEFKRRPDLIAH